ncbi:SGNH/GDSL hydrolase family protein [Rhizobium laguerreae]|uniref:SGNH/GDSL hydrolase family protein n=1 Tax=Rhizobium laguerreae TaxID=1076926 RepID=UPI001C92A41F|nr:SGNH/GDSL hydrolase family protein [Rhizobium laguerreae]MBY3543682.1 SGNH/GDSL hydrolase family protein [Rhizobium laguerreae]
MRQILLFMFLLIVTPCAAQAQAGPSDEMFAKVSADRDHYGQVIFTFGDSIMRGWALAFFPDEATPEQRRSPQWELRSPSSMLRARGFMAVYAGASGQPDEADDAAGRIGDLVKRNIIRSGDVVVLEDAGRHNNDPLDYFDNWLKIGMAARASGAKLIMMTIPDAIKADTLGGEPADRYRYSVEFNGLSHNDATSFAANALQATLIDYKALMLAATVPVLHDDGIHPNVAGEEIMVDAIIDAVRAPMTARRQ